MNKGDRPGVRGAEPEHSPKQKSALRGTAPDLCAALLSPENRALYGTLAAVNTHELCESSGLTSRELERWMETGLLKAEFVSKPGGGRQWDFTADQAERARLLNALHRKRRFA